ncbi:MAG: flagellin [Phycisphaerae bacterium]|nr:flagellin [Phycisphaerae bacterium]
MATINTNVPAMTAQNNLRRAQDTLTTSLERLASGLRINRGADDPAGLIVSENLRAEVAAVGQAIENTQRASLVIATAEGALNEVAALLVDVQDLVVEAANRGAMSDEEIRANQLQIDSAIDSISRIANTTSFAGRKLINGELDYVLSGVAWSAVPSLQIHQAQFGTRDYIPVEVNVTQSAQQAALFFASAQISAPVTVEIAGNTGMVSLSFISGTNASAIAAAINVVSDATGVCAIGSATGFMLRSVGYGSDQWVSVRTLPNDVGGSMAVVDADGDSVERDYGQDAAATVNGASSIGRGLNLILNTTTLDIDMTLDASFGLGSTSFAITGGGMLFQVGPDVNTNLQVNIGIQSMTANRLGNRDVGYLSQIVTGGEYSMVAGGEVQAQQIVDEAIRQVSVTRGRLGAFERNTLDTNVNQLQITLENLTASQSAIRDTDFAEETSNLTRAQILVNVANSVLSIANATPQNVLALLGG